MFNLGEFSMKKTLVAIAALAATASFAQSSVTISGVADVGVTYDSTATGANGTGNGTGGGKLQLGSGNNNRIIFSGVEDLGGGMATTFAFQLRLDPTRGFNERGASNNGNAATGNTAATANIATSRPLFQGETTVGLRGDFGHLKLGRWLTAVQLPNGGYLDPWGVTTVGGSIYARGFASDYVQGGEGRVGNALFYSSPNLSGFGVNVSYGFDKGPSGKQHQALAGTYNNGPVQALLGYERNRFGDSLLNLGGNYNLGVAKVYLGYGNIKGGAAADRAGSTYLSTASGPQVASLGTIKDWTLGASFPMGAATLRAGYSRWNGTGAVAQKNEQKLGFGVKYDLSKRTSIYSDLASTSRKNAALSAQRQFDLGIAHSF
jgi:predicted porin